MSSFGRGAAAPATTQPGLRDQQWQESRPQEDRTSFLNLPPEGGSGEGRGGSAVPLEEEFEARGENVGWYVLPLTFALWITLKSTASEEMNT